MQISQINVYPISLPFSGFFSHSLRKRSSANNVIVEVVAEEDTIKAYGEGAPRTYVTGESQDQAVDSVCSFVRHAHFPWNIDEISQIWAFVDSLPEGKNRNAAICALETALLDAFSRYQVKYIMEYFPKDFYTDSIHYGAGIPLDRKQRVMEICRLIREKMGICRLKLKVGRDINQNREALETIQHVFGNTCDLKIDVNGVWDRDLAFQHLPLIEKFNVKVVEQPMMPDEPRFLDFAEAMDDIGVKLMADESACDLGDVQKVFQEGAYKMVNIRLSKCGGFRRTLKIIDELRSNGMSFQIGCHLGESGILSAAGRALSLLCRDALYYDGSYDSFLLKENITTQDVSFGPGGIAGPLIGPGLGVEVSPDRLNRLSKGAVSISAPVL